MNTVNDSKVERTLLQDIVNSVQVAVADVIASGQWQLYESPKSRNLVAQMAGRIGQRYLQLTSSGTSALEIVLRASGVGVGDEVLLSSYDYPGNFWAIERVGAHPVLLDTSVDSWCINFDSLERAFEPTCKALIVSHLHGEMQKVDELRAWCDHRKVLLVEDICQSLGAQWRGSPIGSYGHAAILSFGGGKLLSCGRGGAWATSDESLAIKARVAAGAGSGPYALSELQAAIVLAQLPWLDEINSICRNFFRSLNRQLKANRCDWDFVPEQSLDCAAFYQCGWLLSEKSDDQYRQKLLNALCTQQVKESAVLDLPFGVGFPGFHRRSSRRCRIPGPLDHSKRAADRTLALHHRVVLHQQWTPEQLANWITASIARIR